MRMKKLEALLCSICAVVGAVAAAGEPIRLVPGRQMFLDDRLIETNTLRRVWKRPVKFAANPVLKPETKTERPDGCNAMAAPFSGGVWYDGTDGLYKCWYHAGWANGVAYAWSRDGISWTRPALDADGGNLVWKTKGMADSAVVILDPDATDGRRFKAFNYVVGKDGGGIVMTSADGIRWSDPVRTADCGDRSTVFYNPFSRKWCYSLRCTARTFDRTYGRSREYAEADDFIEGAKTFSGVREWVRNAAVGRNRGVAYGGEQLYNFDCVAYESVMIGLAEIMTGPENCYWGGLGLPKMVDLRFGFNATPADPDAWQFPDYSEREGGDAHHTSFFIRQTRRYGDWDMGYLKSAGGVCVVVGDELRFYYGGFAGDPSRAGDESNLHGGMYANASMGFATLRRDGFCAMTGPGELMTRAFAANGRYLFVNAAGAVRAFVGDDEVGRMDGDSTKTRLADLSGREGTGLRLRFSVARGELYSFWLTDDPNGASGGYLAAGSPGHRGLRDL